jgi:1,4-dihydroxy-2-naphthoyl-CoA hydrolase
MTRATEPTAGAARDPLDDYRALRTRGLSDTLGIEVVELSAERVVATMPVDDRTRQPFGILHGGASVALAETAISLGAWRSIDRERFAAVGLEINANHLRAKSDGVVRIVATPVHQGRSTQVWTAEIRDEAERLVCVVRCTVAIVPRDPKRDGGA